MRLQPSLVALGCGLALVAALGVVLVVNFAPNPGNAEPDLGLISLLWAAVFFIPPFLIGRRARDRGSLYGTLIGVVPLVVALTVGYSVPTFVAMLFYAFAPIGGFLGQRTAAIAR